MSEAPNLIGLVGDGIGRWALWNREDNATENAVQYIRADLHAADVEALRKENARLRNLLGRYIGHVSESEGTDFLSVHYPPGTFHQHRDDAEYLAFCERFALTDDEERELAKIGVEVHNEVARAVLQGETE